MHALEAAGKGRAGFGSRGVADGNDVVEILIGEVFPRLALRFTRIDSVAAQGPERQRVYITGRLAAGTHRVEAPGAERIDQGFGDDRSAGVAGANDEDLSRLDGSRHQ